MPNAHVPITYTADVRACVCVERVSTWAIVLVTLRCAPVCDVSMWLCGELSRYQMRGCMSDGARAAPDPTDRPACITPATTTARP